jgi:5-formyltetrahydrofolate cyclo-ligase
VTEPGSGNRPTVPKKQLRAEMRGLRAAVPAAERARLGSLIERRVLGMPQYAAAGCVLLSYSFGSEVATAGILRSAVAAGKRVLLPYVEGEALEGAEVTRDDDLVPTGYGPKEPPHRIPVDPAEVDLVVTPGLAFDRRGGRLGYGGGFYDRYLARLRPAAVRAGIGFAFQVIPEVPVGPSDERVHFVVTDAETIDCR